MPAELHPQQVSIVLFDFSGTPFLGYIARNECGHHELFHHAPSNAYGGLNGRFGALNFDYAAAADGQHASDLAATNGRNTATRQVQVGIRADF